MFYVINYSLTRASLGCYLLAKVKCNSFKKLFGSIFWTFCSVISVPFGLSSPFQSFSVSISTFNISHVRSFLVKKTLSFSCFSISWLYQTDILSENELLMLLLPLMTFDFCCHHHILRFEAFCWLRASH